MIQIASAIRPALRAVVAAIAVVASLPLRAQTPLPAVPAGSVFQSVPEAAGYGVVYELNIPNSATYNSSAIAYAQDNSTNVAAGSFTRVAYALELNTTSNPANTQWVWVSFDRPANITSAQKLGVPNKTTANPAGTTYHYPNGTAGDTAIANMNVFSNVTGVTTGNAITTGNIEFWPGDYNTGNAFGVPNANGSVYDFGDNPVGSEGRNYGSMQIHDYGAKKTLFAMNNWGGDGGNIDLGIGNQVGGSGHPDWTFTYNAPSYVVLKWPTLLCLSAGLSFLHVLQSGCAETAQFRPRCAVRPKHSSPKYEKQHSVRRGDRLLCAAIWSTARRRSVCGNQFSRC